VGEKPGRNSQKTTQVCQTPLQWNAQGKLILGKTNRRGNGEGFSAKHWEVYEGGTVRPERV